MGTSERAVGRTLIALAIAITAGCSNDAPIVCESARDCSGAGLVCDLDEGLCVECLTNIDCLGADEVCRGNRCEVVVACTSSRMCPGQVCDLTRMFCVDCVEDADCEAPLECDGDGFCVPPPPESCLAADACVPGSRTRTNEGCEPGMDRSLRCNDACELVDAGSCEPIAGCPGTPECTPTTRARSGEGCAPGESRAVLCNDSCQFEPVDECTPDSCRAAGACTPGEGGWISEGCAGDEVREVVCTDACVYETLTACTNNTCDTPGASEQVACGARCGTQRRFCNASGQWEYEACMGEGVCVPGTTDSVACGNCGTQTAQCNTSCQWTPSGTCGGEGSCAPGTTERTAMGCPTGQTRFATCSDACEPVPTGTCESVVPPGAPSIAVPYMGTPSPASQSLSFRTQIQVADVYFLFDITGSMDLEIAAIQSAVSTVIGGLTCADRATVCGSDDDCTGTDICYLASSTCIESPSVDGCVPDPYTGAGYYETTYENHLSLQPDPMATSDELDTWTTFGGVEALYDSLLALADPSAISTETGCTGPTAGFVGCPAFREEARKIVFVFTDEYDNGGTTTAATAGAALRSAGITLIGVNSGTASSHDALVAITTAAESFQGDGTTPLVYEGADADALTAVTTGLDEVLLSVPQRVTARIEDWPGDDGDALPFVARVRTKNTGGGCTALPTADTDGDSIPDTFTAVPPGIRVCFEVVAAPNTTVAPAALPQLFQARVVIYGDGSPLDYRDVYFVVPAAP